MKSLVDKIDELNNYVKGTLTITYSFYWVLHSYGKETLFYYEYIIEHNFEDLIESAYEKMLEDKKGEVK